MDDPVKEIAQVVRGLTMSSPSHQRHVLEAYFLRNASFDHPFCYTGRFDYNSDAGGGISFESRRFILAIYKWYKILSPVIRLEVKSVAFDEEQQKIYTSIVQVFTYWFIPWYHIHVDLVTVFHLEKVKGSAITQGGRKDGKVGDNTDGSEKWYISMQSDMYQLENMVAFVSCIPLMREVVQILKRITMVGCFISTTIALWIGFLGSSAELNDSACKSCEKSELNALIQRTDKRKP